MNFVAGHLQTTEDDHCQAVIEFLQEEDAFSPIDDRNIQAMWLDIDREPRPRTDLERVLPGLLGLW